MKKIICLSVFASLLFAQVTLAEEIRDFVAVIKLSSDASFSVAEKINYDFGAFPKYGIYRYIPTSYQEGVVKYKLGISELEVPEYQFNIKKEADRLAVRIGEEGKSLTGVNFYGINYLVKGAVTYQQDHDELTWQVTGNGWPVAINSVKAEVDLPKALEPLQLQATCYAGTLGSTSTCGELSLITNGAGLVTGLDFGHKHLLANEGMTIKVILPKGLLSEPGLMERLWGFVKDDYIVLLLLVVVSGAAFKWRSLIISRLKFNK